MSAPLRARAVPAGPAPLPEPRPLRRRPPLRLVDDSRLRRAAVERRRRRLVVTAAVFAGLAFVALAASHAYLVTNQVRIDDLHRRIEEAQDRHQALRLEVATLEAPGRIISVAIEDLGMVAPDVVTYLRSGDAPAAPEAPPDGAGPGPGVVARSAGPGGGAPLSWVTVKRYLGRDA